MIFISFRGPEALKDRWDEKAGLRRDAVRSQVIDVLEAQEIKETGCMKKNITLVENTNEIFKAQQLTIGLDLGDRTSHYCMLDEAGVRDSRAERANNAESPTSIWRMKFRAAGSRWKPGRIRPG